MLRNYMMCAGAAFLSILCLNAAGDLLERSIDESVLSRVAVNEGKTKSIKPTGMRRKLGSEDLSDIALLSMKSVGESPELWEKQVAGLGKGSATHKELLAQAIHLLERKKLSKRGKVADVLRAARRFRDERNTTPSPPVRSCPLSIRIDVARFFEEDALTNSPPSITPPAPAAGRPNDPYALPSSAVADPQPPIPLHALRVQVPGRPQLPAQYPAPCPLCTRESGSNGAPCAAHSAAVLPAGASKKGTHYCATAVLCLIAAGVIVDVTLRKQNSWTVRGVKSCGRGIASFWRWLKARGHRQGS